MRALALALALASSLSGTALAQSADASAEYDQLLREALSEYDAGRYREARAMFERAHEAQPNARTLRGIGMASFELREYVDTIQVLSEALEHPVRPLTDTQRTSVQTLIDRSRGYVGRFVVQVAPPDARLLVDGAPPASLDGDAVLLDLGEHTLSVRCEDCAPTTRTLNVRGGEDEEISIDASSAGTGGPVGATSTTSEEGGVSVGAIALLATGGALAGAAAVAGVWWAGRGDEIALCEAAGDRCHNLSDLQGEQTAAGVVTIGLVSAAVIAATVGVIVLVTSGDDDGESATFACAPTMMGMGCAGTF